jgi:serine phosphatase RsbU (regulator of sigma subunit)
LELIDPFCAWTVRIPISACTSSWHLAALLLRRDGTLERLASIATVLGLFEDWDCRLEERQLFPGDTLVLNTDGMTESFNDSGEEFGEQRLIEAL